jgi:hypothetical protein
MLYKKIIYIFITWGILGSSFFAQTEQLHFQTKTNDFRLSFEQIPVNSKENMGLVGVQYEMQDFFIRNIYFGIGGFGAITGDRGGFFTAGINPGIKYYLTKQVLLDMGIFLGAGGGASAFPGSGKMIRPYFNVGYDFLDFQVFAGLANSNISNKDTGTVLSVSFIKPINMLIHNNKQNNDYSLPINDDESLHRNKINISPSFMVYQPDNGVKDRSQNLMQKDVYLIGLELNYFANKNIYGVASLHGAASGGSDGYGKILGGIGCSYPINQNLFVFSQLMVGMSGGGAIDTEGGSIIQPEIGLEYIINKNLSAKTKIGKIKALYGDFQATSLAFAFSFNNELYFPKDNQLKECHIKTDKLYKIPFHIDISNKTYMPDANSKNKAGKNYETQIDLVGLALVTEIHDSTKFYDSLSILASTYWAYTGDIGAYAEGCLGLAMKKNILNRISVLLQAELGCAGGGGVDIGQGFFSEYFLGLEYTINKEWAMDFRYGVMSSLDKDKFQANSIMISIKKYADIFVAK